MMSAVAHYYSADVFSFTWNLEHGKREMDNEDVESGHYQGVTTLNPRL